MREKLLSTGLFNTERLLLPSLSRAPYFKCLRLADTEYKFYWPSRPYHTAWHGDRKGRVTFEEVLDSVSEEIQAQLLFHLDLFS